MKKFNVNVPDEMAQEFEQRLNEMQGAFEGKLEICGYRRVLDESLPIEQRCRTFEDACIITGKSIPAEVLPYLTRHELAYRKLCIIAEALNEGWKPQFTYEEIRYFPWFTLWWEQELADKSEKWKLDKNITPIPAVVGSADNGSDCGVSLLTSGDVASNTNSSVGGALAVRTSEIAVFFGKQFIKIWIDYIVGNTQPAIEPTNGCEEDEE